MGRRQLLMGLAGAGTSVCLSQANPPQQSQGKGVSMQPNAAQAANLKVAQRYCEAWKAGDRATLSNCYHDEFTLHYGGHNAFSGDHVGKPAALAVLMEVSRRTRRRLLAIVDCMAGPERAVIIAREAFERDGQRAELERVFVYTVRDDKLHECWLYDFDQTTVDRFFGQ